MIEELLDPERRRRRSPQEKIAIVQETLQPGMTFSHVARLQCKPDLRLVKAVPGR